MARPRKGIIKNAENHPAYRGIDGYHELVRQINQAYVEQQRESKHSQKKSFAPSGVGYGNGTCPRYWFIAFNGETFEYSASSDAMANMDAGSQAHERIQNLLTGAGITSETELEITNEDPPIRGFVDGILAVGGFPIEIKTTKDGQWQIRNATMRPPGYNLVQVLIYMKILKKNLGYLLYENKNDHGLVLMPVHMNKVNEDLINKVFGWMRKVKKSSDDNQLPTRPFEFASPTCRGCPVRTACHKGEYGDGVVNIEVLDIK